MTDYINRRDSIRNFERWIEDHDYIKCPKCGVMVKWEFTFFDWKLELLPQLRSDDGWRC